jgi:hypothetical protein
METEDHTGIMAEHMRSMTPSILVHNYIPLEVKTVPIYVNDQFVLSKFKNISASLTLSPRVWNPKIAEAIANNS